LQRDFVAVVRGQGPRANGMPELHKLTPLLGVLQDQGFQVALVTDGRMSGASGKVPAAIHLWPEAAAGGLIGKIGDGDWIELDANKGILEVRVSEEIWSQRKSWTGSTTAPGLDPARQSCGRGLFELFRSNARHAELGGSVFWAEDELPPQDAI
jgi:phosphogluconate dehydratase